MKEFRDNLLHIIVIINIISDLSNDDISAFGIVIFIIFILIDLLLTCLNKHERKNKDECKNS